MHKLIGKTVTDILTQEVFEIKKFINEEFQLCDGRRISMFKIDLFEGGHYHIN